MNVKKRILVLNYEFPPLGGGASPVSYELAKRISETRDFEVDVVTMHYDNLSMFEEINENLRIHRVKCMRRRQETCQPWEQLTYLVSGYLKCVDLIKKHRYDICHTHFIIPTGILSLILKMQFSLPYVVTTHGSDVPGFNEDRFVFLHRFTGPVLRAVSNGAKHIISPSVYLRNLLLTNVSQKLSNKVLTIQNGIDPTKFTPQRKKNYILSSGRLLPRKGFQYLIQAVAGQDLGCEVHIAGDGPMMDELKTLAKNSRTKIVFHGWLNNNGKEYKNLLEQARIYVLASERENASVALLEAMSAGCTIITTNVSGCPETIGSAGYVVDPKDSKQIKQAIITAMSTAEKGSVARRRLEAEFDWRVIVPNYIGAINL